MVDNVLYSPAKVALLTGAGFTKNFGGYLASEMWALILNHVPNHEKLRQCLLEDRDLNYEAIYDTVLKSNQYAGTEKNAFSSALNGAYANLDKAIIDEILANHNNTNPLYRSFLRLFEGKNKQIGFIFTLNQDLLIERFLGIQKTVLPGLDTPPCFKNSDPLTPDKYIVLPCEETIESRKSDFFSKGDCPTFAYVKLHGSYGWKYEDNSNAMVLGLTKAENMEKQPFKWYLELFESVLSGQDVTLVVVGYSFRDSHINKAIANSLKNAQLKLHVVSPKEPSDFKTDLLNNDLKEIWNGLYGYHCVRIAEFFRVNAIVS